MIDTKITLSIPNAISKSERVNKLNNPSGVRKTCKKSMDKSHFIDKSLSIHTKDSKAHDESKTVRESNIIRQTNQSL
jgi:hypothetical protein